MQVDAVEPGVEVEVLEDGEEVDFLRVVIAVLGHFPLVDDAKAVPLKGANAAPRFIRDRLRVDLLVPLFVKVFQEGIDQLAAVADAARAGQHVEMKMRDVGRRERLLFPRLGQNPADVAARVGVVGTGEATPETA